MKIPGLIAVPILLVCLLLAALPSRKLLSSELGLQKINLSLSAALQKDTALRSWLAPGSGLSYAGKDKEGALEFWAVSDRGPSVEGPDFVTESGRSIPSNIFVEPSFAPKAYKLSINGGKAEIKAVIKFKNPEGEIYSGLPPADFAAAQAALDPNFRLLPPANYSLDPEDIASGQDGTLWIASEYGPALLNVRAIDGLVLKVFKTGEMLPKILGKIEPNRGFESVAVSPAGKVFAALQSALNFKGTLKSPRGLIRVLVLDPKDLSTQMLAYPVDEAEKLRSVRIAGMAAVSEDELLLLEKGRRQEKPYARLVLANLSDATDLGGKKIEKLYPEQYLATHTWSELQESGIVPLALEEVLDLSELNLQHEKLEGLALLDDKQTVFLINDSDFSVELNSRLQPKQIRLHQSGVFDFGKLGPSDFFEFSHVSGKSTAIWTLRLPKRLGAGGFGGRYLFIAVLLVLGGTIWFAYRKLQL